MPTEKQVAANRGNASKSTGPRTARGKRRSSFNATRHGATARRLKVLGESQDKLDALRSALYEEWKPRTPTQAELVEGILENVWVLKRIARFETLALSSAYVDHRKQIEMSPMEGAVRQLGKELIRISDQGVERSQLEENGSSKQDEPSEEENVGLQSEALLHMEHKDLYPLYSEVRSKMLEASSRGF